MSLVIRHGAMIIPDINETTTDNELVSREWYKGKAHNICSMGETQR